MEQNLENILIYLFTAILIIGVIIIYLRKKRKESKIVDAKISKAMEDGLHEPISLHPVVNVSACIGTGACVAACPEKDILGIRNGKATIINASRCIRPWCMFSCLSDRSNKFTNRYRKAWC